MSSILPIRSEPSTGDDEPRVVDLEGEDADAVFSALSSGTARQIVSSVHDDPKTQSEIADAIDTSVQNVRYHLDKLEDAGLVEVVDTWYSSRGNEMDVYAAADGALIVSGDEGTASRLKAAVSRLVSGVGVVALASLVVQAVAGELPVPSMGSGAPDGGGSAADRGSPTEVEEEADRAAGAGDDGGGGDGADVDGADGGNGAGEAAETTTDAPETTTDAMEATSTTDPSNADGGTTTEVTTTHAETATEATTTYAETATTSVETTTQTRTVTTAAEKRTTDVADKGVEYTLRDNDSALSGVNVTDAGGNVSVKGSPPADPTPDAASTTVEAVTRTTVEAESAATSAGLPPGLAFFLGGVSVLVVLVVLWYWSSY